MFEFLKDMGNYDSRKIDKTAVNGLTVSTAFTSDEGYETAILDAVSVYPVERYKSREDAIAGHEKWRKAADNLETVKCLGGFDGLIDDEEKRLIREN